MKKSDKELMLSHKNKIIDCINSCKTEEQLDSTDNMRKNYYYRFKDSYSFVDITNIATKKAIELM